MIFLIFSRKSTFFDFFGRNNRVGQIWPFFPKNTESAVVSYGIRPAEHEYEWIFWPMTSSWLGSRPLKIPLPCTNRFLKFWDISSSKVPKNWEKFVEYGKNNEKILNRHGHAYWRHQIRHKCLKNSRGKIQLFTIVRPWETYDGAGEWGQLIRSVHFIISDVFGPHLNDFFHSLL